MTLSLVTGGAGFVGGALVRALRARGERVRILDLAPAQAAGDISGSVTDMETAIRAVDGVDAVFHLAGDARLWAPDARDFERINLGGARVMIEAARRARVRRFVQCSSLTTLVSRRAHIGPSRLDESAPPSAEEMLGPYPRSKRLADDAVLAASDLDAVIALPTEPIGPGDKALTPPTRMIVDYLNGATPASIDCVLNFVPVDSLAEGLIAARDRGRRGERYLLGGENVAMRSLLEALERLSGRAMPKAVLPYWVALAAGVVDTHLVAAITRKAPKAPLTGVRLAGRSTAFSSEKAAADLGWRAAPFEPALAEAIRWLMDEGHVRLR